MQWFYIENGQRVGPVEEADFLQLIRSGKLAPADLVWNADMGTEWHPAGSVPGLFDSPAVPVPGGRGGLTPNAGLTGLARQSLSGRWGAAVGAALLLGILTNAFGAASEFGSPAWKVTTAILSAVVSLFISAPLTLGWFRFCLRIARREDADLNRLFDGFRLFWKSNGVAWLAGLLVILALLPAVIPFLMLPFLGVSLSTPLAGSVFLLCVTPFLIPATLVALNYTLAFFILSDQPELPVTRVLARSRELMHGFRWKYACLTGRFIGWVLLSLFTCFIGMLWVQPYFTVSTAHFYDDVRT